MSDSEIENKEIDQGNESYTNCNLELGDIIEIQSIDNKDFHEQTFFITYIDEQKMNLNNINSHQNVSIAFDEDGIIKDESITSMIILSKSEEHGYANQHLLVPKTWVDIHLGGETPIIITGEITNLEEDMIEITTFPDLDVIYIDFAYKGIPPHLPIEQIAIRTKPASLDKISSLINIREQFPEGQSFDSDFMQEDSGANIEYQPSGEYIVTIPTDVESEKTLNDNLKSLQSSSQNETGHGKDLADITREVEIPEHRKRHGIETQVNDMLDVMLSEIPDIQRSEETMDKIHLLIMRFKELRSQFSKFDEHNNIYDVKKNGFNHKPLIQTILNMDKKLKWVLPVVALKKKLYYDDSNIGDMTDIIEINNSEEIIKEAYLQRDYQNNNLHRGDESVYVNYHKRLNEITTPFGYPSNKEIYLAPDVQVKTSIETIIDNLENFHTTTMSDAGNNRIGYARRQYVIQRYNLNDSYLEPIVSKAGKKIFVRTKMNENENATIKSIMLLPKPVLKSSFVDLPGTSILKKAMLSQHYPYIFKILTKRRVVDNHVIDNFEKEMDKSFWEIPLTDKSFDKNIQNFVLDDAIDQNPKRFEKLLNSMIPGTENIIRLFDLFYDKKEHISMLSVHNAVKKLEPFMVYNNDINYTQFNAIRFFIKNKRREYLEKDSTEKDEYRKVTNAKYVNNTPFPNRIENIFNEKKDFLSLMIELYELIEYKSSIKDSFTTSHEWLQKMYQTDHSVMFHNLIRLMMVSLITPENISEALNDTADESEDMGKYEKIKATDCSRRVLTKKYKSLKNLQKDNGKEVYYDKELDDTPYDIMKGYKDESKKYSSEDMKEFLEEALIQKHDCPPKLAPEMSSNLIQGSKLVNDGEYAILEILPHLTDDKDPSEFSKEEKESLIDQSEILKKTAYYKRVNNQWIHDETVDDTVFIDSNTLFCNMSKICFRDTKKNVCENLNDTEKRLKIMQRKKIIDEFDERFAESFEGLEEKLQNLVEFTRKYIKSATRLQEVQKYRYNDYAFELGKFINKVDVVNSPHLSHIEDILGQSDFVDRQKNIVKFAEAYCRDPMIAELGDSQYWLYCTQTNKPILPTSLFKLASAYMSNDNYPEVLNEICRKQGIIEGDCINDFYSGRLLRKIDFADEDGFDEQGFKVITNELIEKDAYEYTLTAQEKQLKMKDRVFENPDTELVFKLYRTIIGHIGIKTDTIEEFVLRESIEFINDPAIIKSERVYKLDGQVLKEQQKRQPPYDIYRNKLIILIVTSVILVGIQTAVPSFKIQKTFPGCVQSFKGFPENNGAIEDTSGVDYLICILNTLKMKSAKPWNSIKPLPMEVLKQQLIQLINAIVLPKQVIMELYVKKREYLVQHPDMNIPTEHSIQKWLHFMPPVINYEVEKKLKGLSSDYKTELDEMIKIANKQQQKQLDMFKTKSVLFSYALIENINKIVTNKGLLLKTASGVYFTENACCNDRNSKTFMNYFAEENNELIVYIRMIKGWGEVIENVKQRSIAPFIFDPKRSGLSYTSDIQNDHFEKNVYLAFIHYCNLDNEFNIPKDLHNIISEKLPDYPKNTSLMEKIDFLKQNGSRLNNANLLQIMDVVNNRNLIGSKETIIKGTRISGLQDLLDSINSNSDEADDDIVLCSKLRELLGDVLNKYSPKTLVAEDSDETYNLNNWLTHANTNLLERIVDFVGKNANLNRNKMNKLEEQLSNVHLWNMDSTYEYGNDVSPKDETNMYSITQFMRQSVFLMSKVYPEMIMNKHTMNTTSHKHWGFAEFHNHDVSKFIESYYNDLSKFKHDNSMNSLLQHVQNSLQHTHTFLDMIPNFLPIHRPPNGDVPPQSYYSLFSKRTLYMLYSYIWYSVLYEYIKAVDNDELIKLHLVETKKRRRDTIRAKRDEIDDSMETYGNDEFMEYGDDLVEIQIQTGNKDMLDKQIADLLLIFINMDMSNKKAFDLSYKDIEKRITRSKLNEKKMITDFLKNMDDDERHVEDMQKILKLGRWNVGLKKGLVDYSKERYTEERNQLFEQLATNADIDTNDVVIQKDVSEIEAEDAQEVDDFYEEEANDLRGYNGVDGDGQYYEEDRDDDFNED